MPTRLSFDQNIIQNSELISKVLLYSIGILTFLILISNFILDLPQVVLFHPIEAFLILAIVGNALYTDKNNSFSTVLNVLANISLGTLTLLTFYFLIAEIKFPSELQSHPIKEFEISAVSVVCFFFVTLSLVFRKLDGKNFVILSQLCSLTVAVVALLASFGNKIGLYDYQFAFNIIVVGSFAICGFALFFTTLNLNKNDRDRETAIDTLKLKEFELLEAQKLSHVGSWTLEVGSRFPKWSSEMYSIYGFAEETHITLELLDSFFLKDDLENIRVQMKKCKEDGTPVDIKHTLKRHDGIEKIVHGRAELRWNKITGKKEIQGTLHDITEISTTLADLLETKKMYTDLYNEAPDMLLSVNPKTGLILKCNNTLLKNLGYQSDEVVGQDISKFYTKESYETIHRLTEAFVKTGTISNVELAILRKDGSTIDVSLSSTLVPEKNGEVTQSRSIWRNISDLKIARELEIRKRAADESSRIKSNFVATMSHEIRTPLNCVIGMTEVLMTKQLTPEQYEIVDTIKQSANTLFFLVNDILDFSKIESGKMELVSSYFSLNILLAEIEKQTRWVAFKKELNISFSLTGGDRLNFYGDRNRIQQILTNLISNSIKFTEAGSVDVDVTVTTTTPTRSKIFFSVVDTGIGISTNDQGLLFKPFYQSDSSRRSSTGGTGLGLSISQNLAELMGSKIQIESELEKGSRFFFDIELPHEIVLDKNVGSHSDTFIKFERKPDILVAEDIDTNRKVLGLMLADMGCNCTFVTNGEDALTALQSQSFDLVLMDCQMPILDGIEAVKKIRAFPNEKNKIPVVAVTAHAGSEDRKRCLTAGMSDYISKPFTKGILNDVLTKWLSPNNPERNSIVDERILSDLKSLDSENSGELVKETVSIFEKNLPNRIEAIKEALKSRNQDETRNAAHTLKSAASAFGGSSIAHICNVIIDDVKQQKFTHALLMADTLSEETEKTKDYIFRWILSQPS